MELNRLLNIIDKSAQTVELDQNKVGRLSRMDAMQGQALAQAGEQRQKHRLSLIDKALLRIEQPDFGRCIECDDWIAIGRLELDPAASHCVRCKAGLE